MIWLNEETGGKYIKNNLLKEITPLERSLLIYFIQNPYVFLTKTQVIEHTWQPNIKSEGVSDDALYKLVHSLRSKIKAFSNEKFIENWRGNPEGGYRFNPAGIKPNIGKLPHSATFLPISYNTLFSIIKYQAQALEILNKQTETFVNEIGAKVESDSVGNNNLKENPSSEY